MKKPIFLMSLFFLICILGFPSCVSATDTTEQWIVRTDFWGVPAYYTLNIEYDENQFSGDIDGEKISGNTSGNTIAFSGNTNGQPTSFTGTIKDGLMTGQAHYPEEKPGAQDYSFKARKVPERSSKTPVTHRYDPLDYSNTWDADRLPVMTIWPKDSVKTKTIDSGGIDENGDKKALFGNPQTGPFFIAGAEPGDTLAIHLDALKLNRDYADSLDSITNRAIGSNLAGQARGLGRSVRWTLDFEEGVARPEAESSGLTGFSVPLRPMLGGMAVAPGFGSPAISTGDTGNFGGNMDFPEIVQGNTVYLSVQRPGALLYLGDAHALQGEGETTQFALETSMDVTFTVDLIKGQSVRQPRVESPEQIMVLGQAGTMEEALQAASAGMIQWLNTDYNLSLSEIAQVMGVAMEYSVVNLAGRNVGVAAKIDKSILPQSIAVLSLESAG